MTTYIIIALLITIGVLLTLFILQNRRNLKSEQELVKSSNRLIDEKLEIERRLESEREKNNRLTIENTRYDVEKRTLETRLAERVEEQKKAEELLKMQFKNLANEILEEKSKQFKITNKESLDTLLNPFKEEITKFRERVDTVHAKDNEQRGALKNEMNRLLELNNKITKETTNLTNALKGNSKTQGDWGETILKTILESFNFTKGVHYTLQESIKDADGRNIRPDAIVNLPEGRRIIIDSKVSLTAYVEYSSADEYEERKAAMQRHLLSVRRHIDQLGKMEYQDNINESPDFTVMFIPNEAAYIDTMRNDSQLWEDASKKKIILSSQTNLFAILKIVEALWRNENQNKNAIEIADRAGKMYDKLVGFVESLEAVGKNIDSASSSYQKAMGQLHTGSGNIVRRAEQLRELGAKSSKTLPKNLVELAEEVEDN